MFTDIKNIIEIGLDKIGSGVLELSVDDVDVYVFPQMSNKRVKSYAIVVYDSRYSGKAAIFFDGQFAYMIHSPNKKFAESLSKFYMPSIQESQSLERKKR